MNERDLKGLSYSATDQFLKLKNLGPLCLLSYVTTFFASRYVVIIHYS